MAEPALKLPELPNLITFLAEKFKGTTLGDFLVSWENIIFSLLIIFLISVTAYFVARKSKMIPSRLQSAAEMLVGGLDDFITGILGTRGRKYTPFIGTLFIYIIIMNVFGLIPFMKSPTTNWSTTLALALCVFVYVQYSAFKELGLKGYVDHLMGNPRGILAYTVVIPLLMFVIHLMGELIKPLTLSLRLRSNIWGDDLLLAIMTGFGFKGLPMLFFNTLLVIIAAVVQALVFCLLTTVYFAIVMPHEDAEA
jgi:F-type H+-transporting ATPase subunit a